MLGFNVHLGEMEVLLGGGNIHMAEDHFQAHQVTPIHQVMDCRRVSQKVRMQSWNTHLHSEVLD